MIFVKTAFFRAFCKGYFCYPLAFFSFNHSIFQALSEVSHFLNWKEFKQAKEIIFWLVFLFYNCFS
jgi:hypothetical protein